MDVDVRELGGSRVIVHVSLDVNEVQSAFDKTYGELSQRGGVKGFRPGKVPRTILERYYDPNVIRAVTYEALVQDRFEQACEDNNLRPVSPPSIEVGPPPDEDEALAEAIKEKAGLDEDVDAEAEDGAAEVEDVETDENDEPEVPLVEGEAFEFHTVLTVFPRPALPDIAELKLRRPVAEVTDEQIQERMEQLRDLNATEVEVDRDAVAEGDLVTADLVVAMEGEELPEGEEPEPQQQDFVVGQREYTPPIDREMIGHAVGDTVELEVDYPEDHEDAGLAGRKGTITATITSLKGRELPELSDEFAASIGEYETLDDLRENVKEQIAKAGENYAAEEMRSQALRYIIEGTEVEIPEEFITDAADRSFEGLQQDLQRSGMSLEDFAEAANVDEDTLAANQRARAESGLKLHFALESLSEQWGIEASETDMLEEMQAIADETGSDLMVVQQAAALQPGFGEELRDRATRRMLVDRIVAEAQVEDVPADEYQAEQEAEAAAQADEEPEVAEPAEGEATETPDAAEAESVDAADQESDEQ